MSTVLMILTVIIPGIAMLVVVYILMNSYTKQNARQFEYLAEEQSILREKMNTETKSQSKKVSIPLIFQAYERMILFLERINPPNLITRTLKTKMTVSSLQSILLATVREEYEHNMSQQLYVSNASWDLVKAAKEDVMRLINTTAGNFDSTDDASAFAKEIITGGFSGKVNPIEKAIESLKNDIRKNFS